MSEEAGARDERAREVQLEVLRTARVAVLGGERSGEERPGSTWFVLHGYRQLAHRFVPRVECVAGPRRRIVAPEGLSRFYLAPGDRPHGASDPVGASWMTREDREAEIRDYVRYLDRVAHALPGAEGAPPAGFVTILGFSQGAHTGARWAALGRVVPSRLVLWGAGLPEDLPRDAPERFSRFEVILVRGEADRLRQAEEEARAERLLAEWGGSWREIRHDGGHEIVPGVLQALADSE